MSNAGSSTRAAMTLPKDEYARMIAWLERRGITFSEFARRALEHEAEREGLIVDLSVQLGGKREGAGRPASESPGN